MKKIRLIHRYLGLFLSPALLFFSFSGALLTFNLHSPNKATGYLPPSWVVVMAQIHRKQTISVSKEKSKASVPTDKSKATKPDSESGDPEAQKAGVEHRKSTLLMKWLVVVMSVGFIVTTLIGIYMSIGYGGDPRLVWGVLVAGTVLPSVLLLL